MLINYFKITLRNLYKEKIYAAINISGLSLGIACCIILGLFLHSEFTYDRYNLKHKRIFRVATEFNMNGTEKSYPSASRVVGPLLARDYPEVEAYVRFRATGRPVFQYEGESFYWDGGIYLADDNVFDVFTHDIIYGNPDSALSDLNSMAISESFAKKCFGNENPIGKIISTSSGQKKITLVFADLPENCHKRYDVLFSINGLTFDESQVKDLLFTPLCHTYLLMSEGYKAESFKDIGESFYDRYAGDGWQDYYRFVRLWIQPLADIYLDTETMPFYIQRGNILHLYAFTAVAVFILLVACINYMNIATARSMKRGREVGVRKVLGAARPQLIAQFLGESVFFALVSLLIGLVLVEAVIELTPINNLLGKQELMNLSEKPVLLLWILGGSLAVGLMSGIYPAFYLSSVQPVSTLKEMAHKGKKGFRMRYTLMLIQFIISIGVIASTIIMALQVQYVTNKPLGFNKENRILVRLAGEEVIKKYPIIKTELLKDSRILNISKATNPMTGNAASRNFYVENNEGVMGKIQPIDINFIREDFIKTMGMSLVRGRGFSSELQNDVGSSVLVNEALVKKMGWDEPIGKRIQHVETYRVIGVVKDFHYQSMHHQVKPLIMMNVLEDFSNKPSSILYGQASYLIINVSEKEISKTLDYIKGVFSEFDTAHPFEYHFLDDRIAQLYNSEQRLMKLTGIFSGVCVLISCLGLFGLAAFTTEQRTKEIGVRKVLGASTFQIIVMLSQGILLIVMAASVIASLIAWFAIDEWLTEFAYHAGINPLVFVLSAVIALAVAFGTIALQSFKTANENPVKALRYE